MEVLILIANKLFVCAAIRNPRAHKAHINANLRDKLHVRHNYRLTGPHSIKQAPTHPDGIEYLMRILVHLVGLPLDALVSSLVGHVGPWLE